MTIAEAKIVSRQVEEYERNSFLIGWLDKPNVEVVVRFEDAVSRTLTERQVYVIRMALKTENLDLESSLKHA